MEQERREDERVTVSLEVFWDGGSGSHPARISDISLGGCYLDTMGPATPGEVISLRIKLPSGAMLNLRGEVAYQFQNLGFSVRFSYLTEEEEQQLAQLITS